MENLQLFCTSLKWFLGNSKTFLFFPLKYLKLKKKFQVRWGGVTREKIILEKWKILYVLCRSFLKASLTCIYFWTPTKHFLRASNEEEYNIFFLIFALKIWILMITNLQARLLRLLTWTSKSTGLVLSLAIAGLLRLRCQ